MPNLAVFASGTGSNAEKIFNYFNRHKVVRVKLLVCNHPDAGVIEIANSYNIPVLLINKDTFFSENSILEDLSRYKIDCIVLAGFLWKVPDILVKTYNGKMLNIHPALLPAYGGRGMYGMHVHKAVIENKEQESGITIHFVNEVYDDGEIIFQAKVKVETSDTPGTLAQKIKTLEHRHYPEVIEKVVLKQLVKL